MHARTLNPSPSGETCSCKPGANRRETGGGASPSVSWERLELAHAAATAALQQKFRHERGLLCDPQVEVFDTGFCVAAGGGDKGAAHIAFAGVRNYMPYTFVLSYDLSILHAPKVEQGHKDVMWVELAITAPAQRMYRLPLKATGVVRYPESGALLRLASFELVPELAGAEELLKILACILACVGAACGWECWAPCLLGPGPCIACVTACATALGPEIMACIEACHAVTA